jgi:hypothetical protein
MFPAHPALSLKKTSCRKDSLFHPAVTILPEPLKGPTTSLTPFDVEENHGWPPLPSCQEVWALEGTLAQQPDSHICHYCWEVRHWNNQYPHPHKCCDIDQRCAVPLWYPMLPVTMEDSLTTTTPYPTTPFHTSVNGNVKAPVSLMTL